MYTPKTFSIPSELVGISQTTITEHIKLYEGYVKHLNLIMTKLGEMYPDKADKAFEMTELGRRFSFEFNGMKNHEHYFEQLEGGAQKINAESEFGKQVINQWGSIETFLSDIAMLAKTRGIGWAVVWRDRETKTMFLSWVDEQHLGQLNSCDFLFGIDMWEHSFVADYLPSGKGKYIEDYLANVNWGVVEKRFEK